MKLGIFYGTGWINEANPLRGRLKITQERIDISTNLPKRDPNWTFIDSTGHFHAMSGEDYPTLSSKHVAQPCDGSCGGVCGGEGYSTTEWSCIICGEQIRPGAIPGPHYGTTPGRYDWNADLEGQANEEIQRLMSTSRRNQVMLRFEADEPERWTFFGAAGIGDISLWSDLTGFMVKLELYAAGELGDRPRATNRVVAA